LTRKPEWPKDFKLTATVSQAEATIGLLAALRPISATPGPTKPIDCNTRTNSKKSYNREVQNTNSTT
jgi:hypothetical protein